jgi:MoaA/NifB/PqqE/SkfB family radical SAM enzyme
MRTIPDIAVQYEQFPDDYVNDVRGWSLDESTVKANAGRLLTLDIDFGSRCSLNCPFCFRRDNSVDTWMHELQFEDLVRFIEAAKGLGVRSVKLLGAGEPLENPRIIEFLRILRDMDIIPVLFTKTGVIGDDRAVAHLFSYLGISTAEQLACELNRCGASIVVGFNSFDDDVQRRMVGNGAGVIAKRNRGLQVLVDAGFAASNPTRLAIGVNPLTIWNCNEAVEIYKWARLRNIYAVVTPTMISGRAKDRAWEPITPSREQLVRVYTDIYRFNLATNLTPLTRILSEGISAYAGAHPCNQVAAGLYLTLNGVVLSCPGSEENIEGNLWRSSLAEIWRNSSNCKRGGTFNCRCVAKDGKSIPSGLYQQVLENLTS